MKVEHYHTSVFHFVEAAICLGSNIADFNARERLVILQGADRNHKNVSAIILAIDKQPSLDYSMSANGAEATDPPLGCSEGGAVDFPLVRVADEGGCSLELAEIGSVAEFGLRIASNDLKLFGWWDPLFDLFIRPLRVDDGDECYEGCSMKDKKAVLVVFYPAEIQRFGASIFATLGWGALPPLCKRICLEWAQIKV